MWHLSDTTGKVGRRLPPGAKPQCLVYDARHLVHRHAPLRRVWASKVDVVPGMIAASRRYASLVVTIVNFTGFAEVVPTTLRRNLRADSLTLRFGRPTINGIGGGRAVLLGGAVAVEFYLCSRLVNKILGGDRVGRT